MTSIDVIVESILRAKLDALVADMGTALVNTTRCAKISTSHRFACGLLDRDRQLVALDNPMHLATAGASARKCVDYYEFATSGDDVIICNDPYGGGSTAHYFTVVAPIAYEHELVAYAVVQAHMVDIGGMVMGNYNPGALELWAEGARFTPIKIVVDGKVRRDVLDTIVLNSREPDTFRTDIEAMIATATTGGQRLGALIGEYGLPTLERGMAAAIDYTQRRVRAQLRQIPEGVFRGEATLDQDGHDGTDLRVRVALSRTGDEVVLDFRESDDQSVGFVNSTPETTHEYALVPLLALLDESVLWNDGVLRAVTLQTRRGSVVDPEFPAPTGWSRDHVGYEIFESVAQALALALPQGCGVGYANRSLVMGVSYAIRVGDVEEQLGVTDFGTFTVSGSPGRPGGDGWGQPGPAARGQLPSIEEFEAGVPVQIERLEYATDSGGPGRSRGGLGTETVIRFPAGSD
ncbi:MAG: hydantoinase B/oxoprolinase family protein, partial [Solirubrobacteraceae bacterium]